MLEESQKKLQDEVNNLTKNLEDLNTEYTSQKEKLQKLKSDKESLQNQIAMRSPSGTKKVLDDLRDEKEKLETVNDAFAAQIKILNFPHISLCAPLLR